MTAINLVDGQWVRDLRVTDSVRLGRAEVLGDDGINTLVYWPEAPRGDRLESVDPALLAPARGPIGKVEDLYFPPPKCSLCDGELQFDRGFTCEDCGAMWSRDGSDGERPCVDCAQVATVLDVDGKPRCDKCVAVAVQLAEGGDDRG